MLHLSVNTLGKNIFSGQASFLTVPGVEGELTVLKGHIPLITSLKEGRFSYGTGKKNESLLIKGGVLEVSPREVIVLIDV